MLSNLHAAQIIAAVIAGGIYFAFRLWQASGFKLPAWKLGTGKPATDDAADFAALARLRKRFEAAKCKEGLAACDVALTHFFHGGE